VYFIAGNLIRLISGLFEPFMPSFSAKVNYILNIKREEKDEYFIEKLIEANRPEALLKLIEGGHTLNKPVPLFAEVSEDEVDCYREKYKGNAETLEVKPKVESKKNDKKDEKSVKKKKRKNNKKIK